MRQPPYSLTAVHSKRTAAALRHLAIRADKGEIIGVAYAALDQDRKFELGVGGALEQDRRTAHFGADKLRDMLLHYTD
ncbi:hypothetical protein [Niveibacterium sp. SC-1]|uniref:hypothetical protein n=1 Tax=Niveibacterium sp. SC-1 TaxID=3135646 RepID=UPI003120468C